MRRKARESDALIKEVIKGVNDTLDMIKGLPESGLSLSGGMITKPELALVTKVLHVLELLLDAISDADMARDRVIESVLRTSNECCSHLRSEDAKRHFKLMLLKGVMDVLDQDDVTVDTKRRDVILNKNVLMWLAEAVADAGLPTSRDFIIDKPSAMVRALYEEWCEESHETALGITNFNSIVELETGLVRKTAFCSMTNRREAFEWWKSQGDVTKKLNETSKRIACWIDDRD